MKTTKSQDTKGFTLVEIMVAMLITFIVMGAAFQTLTRETIDMEKRAIILDMQNNARVSVDRITREIRRAGFFGCGGDLAANTLNNDKVGIGSTTTIVGDKTSAVSTTSTDADYWNANAGIIDALKAGTDVNYLAVPLGFHGNAAATHPRYASGSDAISLVYFSGDVPLKPGHTLTTDTSTSKDLKLARAAFAEGDILLITDCEDYSIFQKTNGPAQLVEHKEELINNDLNLGKAYGVTEQARVYSLKVSTFFIGKGDYANELYHNNNKRSIASNIEDLQFQFITDLDDLTWAATIAPAKPEEVRAIKVWVLARSEVVGSYTNKETYSYAGKTVTPNDNRYRYLTSAVVYLRNAGTIE